MTTQSQTFTEVPVIDVAPLVEPDPDREALARTAHLIGQACRDVGFFYVRNHGIDEGERGAMLEETRRFFDLPLEEKMKLRMGTTSQFRGYVPLLGEVTHQKRDYHECIDLQPLSGRDAVSIARAKAIRGERHPLDDPGQWPEILPSFRTVMMRAWDRLYALGGRIAEGMALSLGLEPTFFQRFTGDELCDLRLSHYPPSTLARAEDEVGEGMGAHVDYGFLSILQQDEVGGLEVRNATGTWIAAPHIPGTCLVNIGLMMQRWTNDRYRATWHRVALPEGRHRYSTPFFFEPSFDAVVAPLDACCDEDDPPRYEPCQFGPWVVAAFSTAYDDEGEAPAGVSDTA